MTFQGFHKRRGPLQIMAEILKVAENGLKKTGIMYDAKLSYAQLNEYLKLCINLNLLRMDKKIYKPTKKGKQYLERYDGLIQLLIPEKQGSAAPYIKESSREVPATVK